MKREVPNCLRQVPWFSVGIILLIGLLISGGIVFYRICEQNSVLEENQEKTVHTLVFLNEQGQELSQQQVLEGSYAIPPKLESINDGIAFRCWNQKLYGINRSTEIIPVYQNVLKNSNAFYMDAQYAELNEEIQMDLWLNGVVCLSSIELTLEYDPDVLVNLQCDVEGDLFQITASEKGKITICLDASENVTEALSVAKIRFMIAQDRSEVEKAKILLKMKNPKMMVDGTEVGTDSSAVHGDIYILS